MSSVRSFSLTRSVFSQPCGVCPKTHPIFRLRANTSLSQVGAFRSLGKIKIQSLLGQMMKHEKEGGLAESFRPENFIPGLIIGFIFGFFLDLSNPSKNQPKKKKFLSGRHQEQSVPINGDQELKAVLVVRQDLKMGAGKIASQCAHAATGMYAELMYSQRTLLRQWEQSGQPKIVVTCKNQQEMNKIKEAAESIGLPTFVVADAGRTQVSAGSKTVLAVGPGPKELVDSVTGKLRLL